jgi:hypothetical protein
MDAGGIIGVSKPTYLETAKLVAHLDRGTRALSWTIDTPGELYRNRFYRAELTVREQVFLAVDSPLYLRADRVVEGDGWHRDNFTPNGREKLHGDVIPWIVDGPGFDALWTPAHRQACSSDDATKALDELGREIVWWERKRHLQDAYSVGLVELEQIPDDSPWPRGHGQQVRVVSQHTPGRFDRKPVVATLHLQGKQVGWLTDGGAVIPLADCLGP